MFTYLFPEKLRDVDTWKSYLYYQTGYVINLNEALPNFYLATYSLFMGVSILALFIGLTVTITCSLEMLTKLVAHEKSVTDHAISIYYRWLGLYSIIIYCQVLLMFIYYLVSSFKELSSNTYPNLFYFSITCHITAYVFIWIMCFSSTCCMPRFVAKKFFKNKLNQLVNRSSFGCYDRLTLGFMLTLCTIVCYHVLFGVVVLLHYPLLVICVMVSRITYLIVLGLCVFTSVRLYMTFGICHLWIYCSAFIQIVVLCLYYSVLCGVSSMLGVGYILENSVLLKYIIVTSVVSIGVVIVSYYVYIISCKPLFYSEKEYLKAKRKKKREDNRNDTVINMSEMSPAVVGKNELAMIKPMADNVVQFTGGVLLIQDGSITWIPVNQK